MKINKISNIPQIKNSILPAVKIFSNPLKQNKNIQFSGNIINFQLISSMYPNVSANNVEQLLNYCMKNGIKITKWQVKRAIENYVKDAEELKPVFKRAQSALDEFEDKISKIDFNSQGKIINIFKTKDRSNRKPDSDWFFDDIPSKESIQIQKNIAQSYIDILKKELPEYEIEIADDGTEDAWNYMMQISVQKGDNVLLFFYDDFISSIKKGKLEPNVNVILSTPDENDYYYIYEGQEEALSKVDKLNNEVVGIISKNCYNEQGKPYFYTDDMESSGPTYYALAESLKTNNLNQSTEVELDNVEGLDEELLNIIKNSIKKDILVERFYKKYGLGFILSCIRDGKFNMKVAQANAHLNETARYYSEDNSSSQTYINEIIYAIEDDNHNINEYLLDIAQEFLSKELNLKQSHHRVVLDALSYIKNNYNAETVRFGENLSDEFFSFEEINLIIETLNSSNKEKQKNIISKINKLAIEYDVADEFKPPIRLYQALILGLNKKS